MHTTKHRTVYCTVVWLVPGSFATQDGHVPEKTNGHVGMYQKRPMGMWPKDQWVGANPRG